MFCQDCGAEPQPNHKFCVECGASLPSSAEQDQRNNSSEPTTSAQEQSSRGAELSEPSPQTCEWCDYALEDDARFCIECGRRVMGVEYVRAAAPAPKTAESTQEKPMSDGDVGFLAGLFGASTGCGCGCLPIIGIFGFFVLLAALFSF